MTALICLAAVAFVYRVATRQLRREEAALFVVAIASFLMVWAQIWVADGRPFPERRYWLQGFILLFAWASWGLCRLTGSLEHRVPAVRFVLPMLVVVLLALDVVAMFKPLIPVGRRHVHVKAGNWAVEAIQADWKGPKDDARVAFSTAEYHSTARPIVETPANMRRVGYLVGGRYPRVEVFGEEDAPDYVLAENHQSKTPLTGDYELMAERSFGKRHFALYRRKTKHGRKNKP